MIIKSEQEMIEFGREFARGIVKPAVIELVGDVGAGKTTFTKGLAEGLGVQDEITSPSFTISKVYKMADGG
ncbi:MAG: tRNA (adenosine(37)-N6)-threonylcarbamoyltransferase complex ATPase subunit type 1 TsaE, partial [Candidatus Saccharibacteria bacterium]|nr:tRNA (adenosine(37)-N6)-threonylcarbamoyltransferase complex ATPase subunit type 1 TsaE [Candidatus Saccharibacteria bacterium]